METIKFDGIMVTSLVRSQNKLWDKYLKAQSETKKSEILAEIHSITETIKSMGCNTLGDYEEMMCS